MNGSSMTITNPFGICAFGSALLRVSPDSAIIRAAITRLEEKPSDAFAKARDAAQSVTGFLRKAHVKESGLSRISLAQEYRFFNNERRPVGYVAKLGLTVILSELDHTEEIVSGLVDAGANEINAIEFHTVRLKELRANARKLAMQAAREKAEIYAAAGHVTVGEILHIQDVNPNLLKQELHAGAARGTAQHELADDEPEQGSLDPSAIQVGAAVVVAYRIAKRGSASRLASLGGTMPRLKDVKRRRPERKIAKD
jgi:uncharacterized protein YggE